MKAFVTEEKTWAHQKSYGGRSPLGRDSNSGAGNAINTSKSKENLINFINKNTYIINYIHIRIICRVTLSIINYGMSPVIN